nr:response regulator [Clostridiales bacterium]
MAKILVADDEELIRKLVSDFLKKDNHTVIEAKDGDEALYYYRETQDIDLMILDIMMPGKDGWEVCREVRKKSNMPI